jgi:rubrerythrin
MTRIEKFVVIVLGVLSLAFLGQIIGSAAKSQATTPVTAQQSATAQMAEQLRHRATVVYDKLQAHQCLLSQSRGAKNACEADFRKKAIDLISNINEAERRDRSDLFTEAARLLTEMESTLDASMERIKRLEQWVCKESNYVIEGVRSQYPFVLRNC